MRTSQRRPTKGANLATESPGIADHVAEPGRNERIKSSDYDGWGKFDVVSWFSLHGNGNECMAALIAFDRGTP